MIIDGIKVSAVGFNPSLDELKNYVNFVKARVPDVLRISVSLNPDDTVDIDWTAHHFPFQRIRRITGYLTGDLKTWNDAKQAEESERVKHDSTLS